MYFCVCISMLSVHMGIPVIHFPIFLRDYFMDMWAIIGLSQRGASNSLCTLQSSAVNDLVQFIKILHVALRLQWQKLNQILESQQTFHT